jgi:Ca2+-binding RTX toxin-like protein
VTLPASLASGTFSVRAGTRSIGIDGVSATTVAGASTLVLQLRETLALDAVVRVSYSGNQIGDALGNPLPAFGNRIVTHVSSDQSIASPNYSVETISLGGDGNTDASGNEMDNRLFGNNGDNILSGGRGGDLLTGGPGRDTFKLNAYSESVLLDPITRRLAFDRIADLAIGTDIIDAPMAIDSDQFVRVSTNTDSLTGALLNGLLPSGLLKPYGGAIVTMMPDVANRSRTLLVLNDNTAGYNQNLDTLVEITGFTGLLDKLQII